MNPPLSSLPAAPPSAPTTPRPAAPVPATPGRRPVRRRVVAFALVASGLLVAGVLAFSGIGPGRDAAVTGLVVEPEAYTASAVSQVASLSSATGTPLPSGVAGGLPQAALDDAQADLDAAIARALAAFEQTLADAALPDVPVDYVAGVAPDVTLPAAQGYLDGSFAASLPTGPVAGTFSGIAFTPQASPVGAAPSSLPIEDILAQVEAALQQVEDALGQSLIPPLPVVGDAPAQANGAQGTLEPDEQGALLADRHATALLGATSGAYGTTSAELTALLAGYQRLATSLEQAIAQTQALGAETSAGIEERLEERLAGIDAQARTLTTQATRLAAEHRKATDKAHATAIAAIESALDMQVEAVERARVEALANVTASAAAAQRDADATKDQLQALVDKAVVDLGSARSPEALAGIEAIRAAGVAATLKVDRDAKARIQAIEDGRAGIEARADEVQAELAGQAEAAVAGLEALVSDALGNATDAKAYLVAVAKAQAELAQERELELAEQALADVEAAVEGHVEGLLQAGLAATASADGIVEATSSVVGAVEDAAVREVGKDLEYITKVSEDYGRVPTDERKQRASHWSSTAVTIEGLLDGTLATGQSLEMLAQRTAAAAARAQAEIEAMA